MKKPNQMTTLALAKSVRKAMPPPSKVFKVKSRFKRNDWKKDCWN
jgi:hypothetical protein